MKRISIFCDGTWNSPTLDQTTHVHKLWQATIASEPDQSKQICHYIQGVGTGKGARDAIERWIDKKGGGAFGWGLSRNIKDAYRWLALNYDPDDEIYLFGFSRGAFTARSLGGMIRKSGLPDKAAMNASEKEATRLVNAAFELYRRRGEENAPDKSHIQHARRLISPHYATSRDDQSWRGDNSRLLTIRYIGVWDTVGAMGVPNLLGPVSELINRRHKFHDLVLSSSVLAARHALALDERRYFFAPSPWGNLDRYDDGRVGLNKDKTGPNRPFQQLWFAGDHGNVGGSGANRGITAFTMDWIAQGARDAKLAINPELLLPETKRDALAPPPLTIKKKLIYKLNKRLYPPRLGPESYAENTISPPADMRVGSLPDYRPESLKRSRPDLF